MIPRKSKHEDRASEYWFIYFFSVECLEKIEGERVAIEDVFFAYKQWKHKVRKNNSGVARLSIDSFGKLLPKVYERKVMKINGESKRMLLDTRIKYKALRSPIIKDDRTRVD